MKFLIIALALAAVHAVPESAMENVTPFDSVDMDNNGSIDYNEFEKWQKSKLGETSTFSRYDVSHDQTLDVSEFVPLAYEISRKPVDTAEEIFKRMDLNHDRVVDSNEASVARKEYDASIIDGVLAVADVNGDGQLTYEEFTAQLNYNKPKSRKEADKEMAYQILSYIDANRDGKLSQDEIFSFANLSKEEIAKVIDTLDANHDGFLTVGEIERIPGKMSQLASIQPPPTV
ncbi:unnamed protein product [Strongylus vulgaris]|uniref:EF-hand domain-containing protein n=1 Tax=Strongylus vulgaris TaxID=40348 RepID=A0A3P7J768_STRVU|nr:unnamed protein product [Strongylus vulgaris]